MLNYENLVTETEHYGITYHYIHHPFGKYLHISIEDLANFRLPWNLGKLKSEHSFLPDQVTVSYLSDFWPQVWRSMHRSMCFVSSMFDFYWLPTYESSAIPMWMSQAKVMSLLSIHLIYSSNFGHRLNKVPRGRSADFTNISPLSSLEATNWGCNEGL